MTNSEEKKMGWLPILQVALLNIAVTLVILPLDSTLNRIMITELGISAAFVSFLIALRFLTSPLRIWFGRLSDTRPLRGKHRTGYIAIGMVVMTLGFILTPGAAVSASQGGVLPILWAIFVFALLGFGVNLTTPLYFALVADQSSEKQRARIVALMFIMLGVVVVVAAFGLSAVVGPNPLENGRLNIVFGAIAIAVIVMTFIGLIGVEKKATRPTPTLDRDSSWQAIRTLLIKNRQVRRFFIYLVLTFVAIEAQEIVLEPYAAAAFDMAVDETTRLTGIFRLGQLLMLAVGAYLVNRIGHRRTSYFGLATGIIGFALIILTGIRGLQGPFMGDVLVIGMAGGLISVTNLTLMMNMTEPKRAGIYLGAWGFAQAVGVGTGTLLGGVIRDLVLAISGLDLLSYITVYGFEIALLLLAIPFIRRLNITQFKEDTKIKTTQILAQIGDAS